LSPHQDGLIHVLSGRGSHDKITGLKRLAEGLFPYRHSSLKKRNKMAILKLLH
jgi:hypothetical protein